MSPVHEALYNSAYSTTINRRACTVETREKVLEGLKGWVGDPVGAKIYWMNGMAGTGKTTISYTFCEWLKKNNQLGGSYFCSRASTLCCNVNSIVPTLAHQLAQYSHSFQSTLCNILEKKSETGKLNVEGQFQELIRRLLQLVKTAMPDNVVVVIDALDECDDGSALRLFLDTLLKLAVNLSIKFFLTSRPEPAILDKMLASQYSESVLYLHDIEESIVNADIKNYLTEALRSMTPSPLSIEKLAERSGRLFIYAATAVRYICPGDSRVNSRARLQTVLGMEDVPGSSKQYSDLDKLYTSILTTAINPEHYEFHEINEILLVLRTVVCAAEPMAAPTIASLLGLTEGQVRSSLQRLRSVLHIRGDVEGPVAPFHASFPDFLFDKYRSKDQFYCERTAHNELLVNRCFDLMKEQPPFNDFPQRITSSMPPVLSYSCQHWGKHLLQGSLSDTVHKKIFEFQANQLIFWMQVVNPRQWFIEVGDMLREDEGLALNALKSFLLDKNKL